MVRHKKILVLEDDRDIGDVVSLLLEEEGYDVAIFETIYTFKESLALQQADLFIMDVMLPDGNGLDVCDMMKNNADLAHIPILMMSASADFKNVAKTCRANAFISKPFDIDEFISKVNELVVAP